MDDDVTVFDEWEIYEEAVDGSGRGIKDWLKNTRTKEVGLFKYPKEHTNNSKLLTGEHWAENIASSIANLIGVPCAKTEIGTFKGNIGVMSYLVRDLNNEILIEGVQYITKTYPAFDVNRLYDVTTNTRYSIQMIEECINETGLFKQFAKIPVFDCLIGNSDRHQSNWGIITDTFGNPVKLSPVYDNGSSLCCFIKEEDIDSYFKDGGRFEALVGSKSMSAISWMNERKTRQFDLLDKMYANYYEQTIDVVRQIHDKLSNSAINDILKTIPTKIMSDKHKQLVSKFLQVRRDKIIQTYNLK